MLPENKTEGVQPSQPEPTFLEMQEFLRSEMVKYCGIPLNILEGSTNYSGYRYSDKEMNPDGSVVKVGLQDSVSSGCSEGRNHTQKAGKLL